MDREQLYQRALEPKAGDKFVWRGHSAIGTVINAKNGKGMIEFQIENYGIMQDFPKYFTQESWRERVKNSLIRRDDIEFIPVEEV